MRKALRRQASWPLTGEGSGMGQTSFYGYFCLQCGEVENGLKVEVTQEAVRTNSAV